MEYTLSFLFILFISYSFMGWLMETILCSIQLKKIANRGFLVGPLCPIYGIAALIIVYFLSGYQDDLLVLFIMIVLLATILEYFTSYILEKLFKIRWWDYSKQNFNLNGRIVLSNSILFGGLGLIIIYGINPLYVSIIEQIPNNILDYIALIITILFIIDLAITSNILFNIRKDTKEMLKDRSDEVAIMIRKQISNKLLLTKRLLNAFPNLEPVHKNLDIKERITEYLKHKKSS